MLAAAPLVAFAASSDLERSHAFYGGVLGLERVEASEYANEYLAGGTRLRVSRVERVAPAPYTVLGWEVADLDAALAGLAIEPRRYAGPDQDERGIWTAPGGSRIVWFSDPDGNVLSLQQPPA